MYYKTPRSPFAGAARVGEFSLKSAAATITSAINHCRRGKASAKTCVRLPRPFLLPLSSVCGGLLCNFNQARLIWWILLTKSECRRIRPTLKGLRPQNTTMPFYSKCVCISISSVRLLCVCWMLSCGARTISCCTLVAPPSALNVFHSMGIYARAFLIEWLSFLRPLGKSSCFWVPLFLRGLNVQLGDWRRHHFITTFRLVSRTLSIKPRPSALENRFTRLMNLIKILQFKSANLKLQFKKKSKSSVWGCQIYY